MIPYDRNVNVHITSGSIVTALLFAVLFGLLWYLRDIALIVLTAIVIASAMEPGIRAFIRWGISRVWAVTLMYVIVLGVLLGSALFFLPPVLDDAASFIARLPDTLHSISSSSSSRLPIQDIASLLSSADIVRTFSESLGGSTGGAVSGLSKIFGGIESFLLIIVFSFYFCIQDTGVDDFLRVVTPIKQQNYVVGLWRRAQDKIGKWMQGQLLLGFLVGVLLYLGLVIMGVPYALFIAVLAALFELIPIFGQYLAAIPAVVVSFAAGGGSLALMVGGLFIIIQQFESHLIYPLVVKKIVGVPPLLVILALIVGAKLAGLIGVLLAVPLAAALRELVNDIEADRRAELNRRLHHSHTK
ncbi:MAG TPA: AI-2E family transporter [Candidatus Paceibacterota bacterium]